MTLLPAEDALLVLVDCQAGPLGMVRTMQEAALAAALARVAAALGMPVILAAAPVTGSAGEVAPELALVAAGASHIARHRTSVWEGPAFRDALAASGRNTVVFAGIRTVVAVAIPALAARGAGHFCARPAILAVVRHPRRLPAGFAARVQELELTAWRPQSQSKVTKPIPITRVPKVARSAGNPPA